MVIPDLRNFCKTRLSPDARLKLNVHLAVKHVLCSEKFTHDLKNNVLKILKNIYVGRYAMAYKPESPIKYLRASLFSSVRRERGLSDRGLGCCWPVLPTDKSSLLIRIWLCRRQTLSQRRKRLVTQQKLWSRCWIGTGNLPTGLIPPPSVGWHADLKCAMQLLQPLSITINASIFVFHLYRLVMPHPSRISITNS